MDGVWPLGTQLNCPWHRGWRLHLGPLRLRAVDTRMTRRWTSRFSTRRTAPWSARLGRRVRQVNCLGLVRSALLVHRHQPRWPCMMRPSASRLHCRVASAAPDVGLQRDDPTGRDGWGPDQHPGCIGSIFSGGLLIGHIPRRYYVGNDASCSLLERRHRARWTAAGDPA